LEWIDEVGGHHTRYFGHWLDDSKQDAAATTRICMLSCALKEILIIMWRAFLAVIQFGKGQMGWLCLTAVANPSTGRGYSQLNWAYSLMHKLRRRVPASGGLTGRLAAISAIASSACVPSTHRRSQTVVRK
jgi:hypothetical protein